MIFFIDAYNMFFHSTFEHGNNAFQLTRERFIQFYKGRLKDTSGTHIFIFDGKRGNEFPIPSVTGSGNVEVIFSPPDLSADDYIIERLSHDKDTHSICLVSNDKGLLNRAKQYRVQSMSQKSYISLINKKRTFKQSKIDYIEDEQEIVRLERIFSKELNSSEEN